MSRAELVLEPIITEKSLKLSKMNQYTFRVPLKSEKIEIKKAVERNFKVKVSKVSTERVPGIKRAVRNRRLVEFPGWKKAFVSLASGKIDIFEKE